MRNLRAESFAAASGGAAIIEFALVAPMFLALVFGTIEYGRLLWTKQALQQTAIAGARCMAIAHGAIESSPCASGGTYSSSSTNTYIENIASGWGLSVTASDITLYTTPPAGDCGGTSGLVEVTITNTFNTPVPQIVLLAAGGTALTATACYPSNPF
jgi:Flp pilus assembly protein TadG